MLNVVRSHTYLYSGNGHPVHFTADTVHGPSAAHRSTCGRRWPVSVAASRLVADAGSLGAFERAAVRLPAPAARPAGVWSVWAGWVRLNWSTGGDGALSPAGRQEVLDVQRGRARGLLGALAGEENVDRVCRGAMGIRECSRRGECSVHFTHLFPINVGGVS
ncbi:hypothetical protein L227DRAFT_148848 [Lentinus tigrinus ALCF2SS1-6]|uniref:Uncharacterized protein n=1 Tax=Lentinus tigrinus ALCF2SS1-6 TaxID=1328759 RepID=A0A5C2ST61_9APHY|nr:hypothetical protein L227DRAFT_148848 [Lentinus tigrinus ALCF2SS1-6]